MTKIKFPVIYKINYSGCSGYYIGKTIFDDQNY